MRRGLLLSLLLLCLQPFTVNAGEYYWGLMLGNATFKQGSSEFDISTVTGRLGYRLNSYLGAEIRGGMSGGSDKSTTLFGTDEYDINSIGSAFLKASWSPTGDHRAEVYVLGGYSSVEMEASSSNTSATAAKSGPAYGIGLDLYASNQHGLFFEWLSLQKGDVWGNDFTLEHVGVGYIRYF